MRRHPGLTAFLSFLAVLLLVDAFRDGRIWMTVAYLSCVSTGAVIIDVAFAFFPTGLSGIPVRKTHLELAMAAIFFLIAIAWLQQHFSHTYWPLRIPNLLGFLCLSQIALAAFLFSCRYGPRDLGLRLRGFVPLPAIMVCCMAATILVFPLTSYWRQVYRDSGGSLWGIVRDGLFIAGLPEEFFRMFWQTRLNALLNNAASGWLLGSLLWAAMHSPLYGTGRSAAGTLLAIAGIVPYGLLLGYLTFRSKSLLPAVVLHATHFLWMGGLG